MRYREAVDLKKLLGTALRVEPLLVRFAGLFTVILESLRVSLHVGHSSRQSGGVAGPEQHTVDLGRDQLGERAMPRRNGRDTQGHGLDGDQAESLFQAEGSRTARAREMSSEHCSLPS